MSKKQEKPFKRKEVKKKVKNNPLDVLMTVEQRNKLQEIVERGSAIILTGGKYAPYQEVFKGIRMLMKNPTFNGVSIFDTHVVVDKNWTRPLYILTLNDAGNPNILHSIREVKEGKIYQRYIYHPTD